MSVVQEVIQVVKLEMLHAELSKHKSYPSVSGAQSTYNNFVGQNARMSPIEVYLRIKQAAQFSEEAIVGAKWYICRQLVQVNQYAQLFVLTSSIVMDLQYCTHAHADEPSSDCGEDLMSNLVCKPCLALGTNGAPQVLHS